MLPEETTEENKQQKKCGFFCKISAIIFFLFSFWFLSGAYFLVYIIPAPNNFPINKIFNINLGENVLEIARNLKSENYIRSETAFVALDKIKQKKLKAEKYTFKKSANLFEVYDKLAEGRSDIKDIKITILEGEPNFEIAKKVAKKFKNISEENFLTLAKEKEGYLYPDTYQFSPFIKEEDIIKKLEETFQEKTKEILKDINELEKKEILTKASLVENEAGSASYETKRHVAGIIENRLKKGMLLQIDAVFSYIHGYHINRVLNSHLKVDSPYNTYKYKGLPPGPIGNPSLGSIKAVMNPLETKDLYYLTGKDGVFYYSRTGSGHNKNRKHLR